MRFQRIKPALLLIFAAASTLAPYPSIAGTTQKETSWTLMQLSRLRGKQKVKLEQNRVKAENLKTGLVVMQLCTRQNCARRIRDTKRLSRRGFIQGDAI